MFSLIPLPVTPIRPVNSLLPPPDPAPRAEPVAAPLPPAQTEARDPSQFAAGVEPVVLSPVLAPRPGEAAGPAPSYAAAPKPAASAAPADIQMRATTARNLTQLDAPESPAALQEASAPVASPDEMALAKALAEAVREKSVITALLDAVQPAETPQAEPGLAAQSPRDMPTREAIPRDPAPEPRLILTA